MKKQYSVNLRFLKSNLTLINFKSGSIVWLKTLSVLLALSSPSAFAAQTKNLLFQGAQPSPIGETDEAPEQLEVQFPSGILKKSLRHPFKVQCSPEVAGYESWADNDTRWTYTFKRNENHYGPLLVGGTLCEVSQIEDLQAANGKKWQSGTINYQVQVQGPKVREVFASPRSDQSVRDKEPIFLITFDGPVEQSSVFGNNQSYLTYTSENAPNEKMPLAPIPAEQAEKIFEEFRAGQYLELSFTDKSWVLATIGQSLIPGANLQLRIQNQVSDINKTVTMSKAFTKDLSVRSQFRAEVECLNPGATEATCMPFSPISVSFNNRVKWTDAKKIFIEYIPYGSNSTTTVQAFPEMNGETEVDLFDYFIERLSEYLPFLAKYNDTLVESVIFKLKIEPETQARIILPKDLSDIENRSLANALFSFDVRVGSMNEWINAPKPIALYERQLSPLAVTVSVVNLNQSITFTRSGMEGTPWTPITDVPTMIQLIRRYESLGEYRNQKDYVSPLEELNIPHTKNTQTLSGKKNRPDLLQVPFTDKDKIPGAGLYALEISSPTLNNVRSDETYESYYNPQHVLSQVTDLSVHFKKGQTQTLLWVTQMSSGQPVAAAKLEVYNCIGQKIVELVTNKDGLASLPHQTWADDCHASNFEYTPYASKEHYFVMASKNEDQVLTHSSWMNSNSYAMGSPSIDWFTSSISENIVNFQSIVSVNLVKPGQKVPIQIVAFHPTSKGFKDVEDTQLPKYARLISQDDDSIYYDFELNWHQGTSEFTWSVPKGSAAKLGAYSILVLDNKENGSLTETNGDIEVAEFKVPLMSGVITPPPHDAINSGHLPMTAMIRYANGVGAKNQEAQLSYYFQPTTFQSKDFEGFQFGTGPIPLLDESQKSHVSFLPQRDRPTLREGLKTLEDGSLSFDIGTEKALNGQSIADALKNLTQPQKLVLRLRYQDQMGEYQTISTAQEIYNSDAYIGTRVEGGPKGKAKLQAALISTDHKNLTSLRDLKFSVRRIETKVIGEELYGGIIKNSLQKNLVDTPWAKDCTIEKSLVSCSIWNLQAGTYVYEATSHSRRQTAHSLFKVDGEGRVYSASDYYDFGDGTENKSLTLALDKPFYKIGEKAVVSFSSPFQTCEALVTVERSDVIESFVTPDACEKGQVQVPVKGEMAPNTFVSIYLVSGRVSSGTEKIGDQDLGKPTYRLGFANIKVDWQRYRSQVNVTLNKNTFSPRETVEVKAQINPEMGSLNQGTVTFIAIEEKILELRPNETYQLLSSLMQQRYHQVETMSSLEHIETISNVPRSLEDSRKGGDEGGDGGRSEMTRRLFDSLVAFKAGVPVINGEAQFSFQANDILTRFKVFAIAMDSNHKFGTGEARYLSTQDYQSYLNIPSIAYSDDHFPLQVTVQNNSKNPSLLRAELNVVSHFKNGSPDGIRKLEASVKIDSQGSSTINFGELPIDKDGERVDYTLKLYNEKGELVDVVEQVGQVILPSVPLSLQNALLFQMTKPEVKKKLVKLEEALPQQGEIKVTLSNSLVKGVQQEILARAQASSSEEAFLETRLFKALLTGSQDNTKETKDVIEQLLNQLDGNGFVKFYPNARKGDIYLTARILKAISSQKWAFPLLPSSLVLNFNKAIKKVLSREVESEYLNPSPQSWMRAITLMGSSAFLFSNDENKNLAKEGLDSILSTMERDPKPFGLPLDQWSSTDLLSVLGLYAEIAPSKALKSKIYQRLTQKSRLVYSGNTAQLKGRPSFGDFYSDEIIDSAELLRLHSSLQGSSNLAQSLALGLVSASEKSWYNISTLMSLSMAFDIFGSRFESVPVKGFTEVEIPESAISKTMPWSEGANHQLTTDWKTSAATINLKQTGAGLPWVSLEARSALLLKGPRGQGLHIEKTLRNTTRSGDFQAGDVIEVVLKINSATDLRHLVLHDPIPAGSNIMGEAYGLFQSGEKKNSGYWFYFQELSDETTTIKYQYQLNNGGTFTLPPTRIEGIFNKSIFGETPNEMIQVKI